MPTHGKKQSAGSRRSAYAKAQEKARQAADKAAARERSRPRTGAAVEGARKAELRFLSYLFLVSAVTMLLFMMYFVGALLKITVPYTVGVIWVTAMVAGAIATYIYGIFVTARYRRWWWLVVIAIPLSCVPGALAYAWNRRMEIEQETLGP